MNIKEATDEIIYHLESVGCFAQQRESQVQARAGIEETLQMLVLGVMMLQERGATIGDLFADQDPTPRRKP